MKFFIYFFIYFIINLVQFNPWDMFFMHRTKAKKELIVKRRDERESKQEVYLEF